MKKTMKKWMRTAMMVAVMAGSSVQASASQAFTPLWLRDVMVSPDGQQVLFCYKGDIYKVSTKGGTAVQLTTHDSYECSPVWSADGKQIAFASDRHGNLDIFTMSVFPSAGAHRTLIFIQQALNKYLSSEYYIKKLYAN